MSRSLAAYRALYRAVTNKFSGDEFMKSGAVTEIRQKFRESAQLSQQEDIDKSIAEAHEAADFLRQFVVQAELNERGNFAMQVEPHHGQSVAEEAALRPGRERS